MQFKTFDIVPHGTNIDFVGKRRIAVTLSIVANIAVIAWALFGGLNFGVDFAGGTEMEVRFAKPVDPSHIRKAIGDLGFEDASVQTYGAESENSFLIRVGRIALMSEADVKRVVEAVQAGFPVQSWTFNPEIGDKIDFEFKGQPPSPDALQRAVESAGVGVREVRGEQGLTAGTRSFAVITQGIREKVERDLGAKFADATPEVRRVEYVGPAVGRELRNQGFQAIVLAMALIVAYIALRFDLRFAPGVIIAIIHDAVITLGYFAFSGREFNLTSIAVILTVVGYSVNDTVVVYDRIRENQGKFKGKGLTEIVNISLNEVLGRTFLTSFATALSLVGLIAYGVGTIFDFSMAMLFGIISGTYSTWFIAGPMTIWLEERAARKKMHPAAAAAAAAAAPPGRAAHK
jgi:preprotein translocase subunit SecF